MNNLKLTLAMAAASMLFISQAFGSDIKEPLITHDTEIIPELSSQVETKTKRAECLASVIYHEARGEPRKGKVAVGYVVMNRVKHKLYPDTICEVVFQPVQFTGLKKIKYDQASLAVAFKIISGEYLNPIRKATHFHATYVWPKWAYKLKFVAQFGSHRFYQFS